VPDVKQQAAVKGQTMLPHILSCQSNWWSRLFPFPNWVKIKKLYLLPTAEWRRKNI